MSSDKIEYGDKVTLRFSDNRLPWLDGSLECEAELTSRSRGAGDTYDFKLEDGQMISLNPYHDSFIGMYKGEFDDDIDL